MRTVHKGSKILYNCGSALNRRKFDTVTLDALNAFWDWQCSGVQMISMAGMIQSSQYASCHEPLV